MNSGRGITSVVLSSFDFASAEKEREREKERNKRKKRGEREREKRERKANSEMNSLRVNERRYSLTVAGRTLGEMKNLNA